MPPKTKTRNAGAAPAIPVGKAVTKPTAQKERRDSGEIPDSDPDAFDNPQSNKKLVAKIPVPRLSDDDDDDSGDDTDEYEVPDLDDEHNVLVAGVQPEQVDELDAKLLPFLKGDVADFLRFKMLKRRRDSDSDLCLALKKPKTIAEAEYEDGWYPQMLLGAGGFGRVAAWTRKDSAGKAVDEIAIKEASYDKDYVWNNKSGLSNEAVMMSHVNKTKVDNFVQLRSFKCFIGSGKKKDGTVKDTSKWLYYLEYAPHGDLSRLINRYRAWNTYLPEPFLWHIFDGLAKAMASIADLETKADELPKQIKADGLMPLPLEARIIHFDIKPDNIFLGRGQSGTADGRERGGLDTNKYPTAKVGDLGISGLFHKHEEDRNPYAFWDAGTPFYMPPEQKLYGLTWIKSPNYEMRIDLQTEAGNLKTEDEIHEDFSNNDDKFYFTQAMNVWNVGKVMFDLMSLSRKWDYARRSTKLQAEYEANGDNALPNFDILPFQLDANKPSSAAERPRYSAALTNLVEECMKPAANNRISPQNLYVATTAQINRLAKKSSADSLPKVYHKQNEINKMALGNVPFAPYTGGKVNNVSECNDVQALLGANMDPDWEALRLPKRKWNALVNAWKDRQATAAAATKIKDPPLRIVNNKILFKAKPARNTVSRTAPGKSNPAPAKAQGVPSAPRPAPIQPPVLLVGPAPTPAPIQQARPQPKKTTKSDVRAQGVAQPTKDKQDAIDKDKNQAKAQPKAADPKARASQAKPTDPGAKQQPTKKPDGKGNIKPLPKLIKGSDDEYDDKDDDVQPGQGAAQQKKLAKNVQKSTKNTADPKKHTDPTKQAPNPARSRSKPADQPAISVKQPVKTANQPATKAAKAPTKDPKQDVKKTKPPTAAASTPASVTATAPTPAPPPVLVQVPAVPQPKPAATVADDDKTKDDLPRRKTRSMAAKAQNKTKAKSPSPVLRPAKVAKKTNAPAPPKQDKEKGNGKVKK